MNAFFSQPQFSLCIAFVVFIFSRCLHSRFKRPLVVLKHTLRFFLYILPPFQIVLSLYIFLVAYPFKYPLYITLPSSLSFNALFTYLFCLPPRLQMRPFSDRFMCASPRVSRRPRTSKCSLLNFFLIFLARTIMALFFSHFSAFISIFSSSLSICVLYPS